MERTSGAGQDIAGAKWDNPLTVQYPELKATEQVPPLCNFLPRNLRFESFYVRPIHHCITS